MNDFGFYLVMTNPVVGYAKCAEAAVKAGVPFVYCKYGFGNPEGYEYSIDKFSELLELF